MGVVCGVGAGLVGGGGAWAGWGGRLEKFTHRNEWRGRGLWEGVGLGQGVDGIGKIHP